MIIIKKLRNIFRICKFHVFDEGMLDNLEMTFYEHNNNIEDKDIFTSIIIGENGTGKSYLLHMISEAFIELSELRNNRILKSKNKYILEYMIEGKKVYIDNSKGLIKAYINNDPVDVKIIPLPKKIICSSFLLNDKFRFKGEEEERLPIYEYQGVKGSRSIANTKTLVKRTANNIIKSSNNINFIEKIKYLIKFLDLGYEIDLVYEIRSKKSFFEEYINEDMLINELDDALARRKHTPFWKIKYENLKNEDKIQNIVNALNSNEFNPIKFNNKNCIRYTIDLEYISNNKKIIEDLDIIQQLMSIDILASPSIIVSKLGKKYSLVDGSSGEGNLIFTLINILAKIRDNSLIFIDEPEISLHPNWQIKYIHLLKELLKDYYNCHIIIATHSHFMVSDIDRMSSSLTILKNEDKRISLYTNSLDTYGWSAENILYNVFGVPTNRNYYLSLEIDEILDCISKGQDLLEINSKIQKLSKVKNSLLDSDPLKSIISLIEDKVNERI